MTIENTLKESLSQCEDATVMETIDQLLAAGKTADEIVGFCNEGMGLLGERFDSGEAFIPDLMFGGMIMKKAMEKLSPLLSQGTTERKGKTFVIGTVQHDVHDIGKDIAAMVLRGNGFNVIDLGVDVPPAKFVDAVREYKPDFLGMSVLLTTCYKSVTETMDALRSSGLRDSVKTCVSGAAASELVAQHCGIDFYGKTAVEGVNWAKQFE
jgi:5-methyltetrahydrofolate--homocysteine methyltransferase